MPELSLARNQLDPADYQTGGGEDDAEGGTREVAPVRPPGEPMDGSSPSRFR